MTFNNIPSLAKSAAAALALTFLTFAPTGVTAQELSESHLSAARSAIAATGATESFDSILLRASGTLKNSLSANNPDKAGKISDVVDQEALALASRRGQLEDEAARLFGNAFSEAELNEIEAFFNSPTGKKYLGSTPILARELSKSARVWANGITRDLGKNVIEKLGPVNQ